MEKIILQKAATMVWETVGIFDNIESVLTCLEDDYGIIFEDYRQEILDEEGYEPTIDDCLNVYEFQLIYIKEK